MDEYLVAKHHGKKLRYPDQNKRRYVFTDEEKSQYKINLLKAYEPFKQVQRYIVLLSTIHYVTLHVSVILGCVHGLEWQALSVMINDALGYPVLAAVGLYLTGGVLSK
ncbi:hypothetical protein [Vibrio sp. C8]